jgi:hypothetical protein
MAPMGVCTRGLETAAHLRRAAADRARCEEAVRMIETWNKAITAGRDTWWSPTIRAAIVAGMPWADICCPGCQTSRSIDLRTVARHPLASVGSLVIGLRCTWWPRHGADAQDHRLVCGGSNGNPPRLVC